MKTSVGQCTRGINMQLVPVADRKEYDYILLLDTEGTRAPEYWGLDGSEKRDNRMATISILLADATIVVNPGENDAAVKEILPMVLLAYQDSKLAEEKGGQMSSRLFFVYNKIDTQQQNKLNNIVRSLGTSLQEAFIQVNKMSGSREEQELFRIFPRFKVDASNPKESDVRIFGDTLKSFNPPDDVPDSSYGESIAEFTTGPPVGVPGRLGGTAELFVSSGSTSVWCGSASHRPISRSISPTSSNAPLTTK